MGKIKIKKIKIFLTLIILIAIFFLSMSENKNFLVISLNKSSISCSFNLNFSFSPSFIDLLYFNNQAEVIYTILLLRKISTNIISQDQKLIEKKIQFYLSYNNDKKSFTLFSSKDYYESDSIEKILETINKIKFIDLFSLDKKGMYYCVANVNINSLTPLSPALFFLFLFYNPYNLKITNIISNSIVYENPE